MSRFEKFTSDLLVALADAAEAAGSHLDPRAVAEHAELRYLPGWVKEATRALEDKDHVRADFDPYVEHPDDGVQVVVTGAGWDAAEESRHPKASDDEVPASDRIVDIKDNSSKFTAADTSIAETIEAVRGNNEYGTEEPEEKERVIAELESGKRLLEAARVRLDAIITVLVHVLKYLAEKFVDHAIGIAAAAALAALAALLGIQL